LCAPLAEGGEPGAAEVVLGAGVAGPSCDIEIGGKSGIGDSSIAGGRGHGGGCWGGVVEHAYSISSEASAASGGFLEGIFGLGGGEAGGEFVAEL
jgi:hypothetical protein